MYIISHKIVFQQRAIVGQSDRENKFSWLGKNISWLWCENEKLGKTIELVHSVVKILGSYIDLFKDTFLACSLLFAVGGPASVLGYPTKFTSAIVMVMWATIIGPLLASSLHLAMYNPFLLQNPFLLPESSRGLQIIVCFLYLVINTILLINLYQSVQEKIGRMVKRNPQLFRETSSLRKMHKYIKEKYIQFHKNELGKYAVDFMYKY